MQSIHDHLVGDLRTKMDRAPADEDGPRSQAVCRRAGQPERQDHGKRGPRGYDGHKKIVGRKRHLLVDTNGLILGCWVTPASVSDREGARELFRHVRLACPDLYVFADGNYDGPLIAWAKNCLGQDLLGLRAGDRH